MQEQAPQMFLPTPHMQQVRALNMSSVQMGQFEAILWCSRYSDISLFTVFMSWMAFEILVSTSGRCQNSLSANRVSMKGIGISLSLINFSRSFILSRTSLSVNWLVGGRTWQRIILWIYFQVGAAVRWSRTQTNRRCPSNYLQKQKGLSYRYRQMLQIKYVKRNNYWWKQVLSLSLLASVSSQELTIFLSSNSQKLTQRHTKVCSSPSSSERLSEMEASWISYVRFFSKDYSSQLTFWLKSVDMGSSMTSLKQVQQKGLLAKNSLCLRISVHLALSPSPVFLSMEIVSFLLILLIAFLNMCFIINGNLSISCSYFGAYFYHPVAPCSSSNAIHTIHEAHARLISALLLSLSPMGMGPNCDENDARWETAVQGVGP